MDKRKGLSEDSTISAKLFALILNMSRKEQISLYEELRERVAKGDRVHPRKAFFSLVHYATQDTVYKDFIKDISEGGVFIETSVPFTVGQVISLTFPIPTSETAPRRLTFPTRSIYRPTRTPTRACWMEVGTIP